MQGNNFLTNTIGQIIGVGAGRGMSLLLVILGTITMIPTCFAYLSPRLRLIEEELPDIVLDTEENIITISEPVASASSN
ncbi:MFS transporter [Nodularia spumigena CS-584]|jgi:MFS transporter, DHA3 family, macrolide efflux protein|uniref:Uncharacterized protein n=2 Tax=Nodularia spumigena TaxID=70799 RepID=A0A2S0QA76_NODSP|nr:hypothetical protein [Nodularia spumigena]AHJ31341.1 hypothetical protein NSP_50520 [Nodularia spumigena CCY9414]AVZ31268.1 hypothetical protein BMF81_03791 [Nodularia spumigena UHCC 0039]EAW43320.1 Major facilitator superfamily protein [Nodularia spumigena CCY9414]MDB9305990.1 MFS transporter [Nodularia spumigena CS-591/12]MDB9384475.1 MFS transporter [Nodularia spumigena CS-584]